MATVSRKTRKRKKHNPELLRAKRAARALNLKWSDVTRERDRLRQNEIDQRGHEDDARKAAWWLWLRLSGWSDTHRNYWRSGFQRLFARRMAAGADYDSIRYSDEIAETVRNTCGEFSEWQTGDIWDFLLQDYPALMPIWTHYFTAIRRLAACDLPMDDEMAQDSGELELPF